MGGNKRLSTSVPWTFPFNILMLTSSCMLAFGQIIGYDWY